MERQKEKQKIGSNEYHKVLSDCLAYIKRNWKEKNGSSLLFCVIVAKRKDISKRRRPVRNQSRLHPQYWVSLLAQMVKNLPAKAGDLGSVPGSWRSPKGGNGNLTQYSCLENPMDSRAWRATVHGVTKGRTQLTLSHPQYYS